MLREVMGIPRSRSGWAPDNQVLRMPDKRAVSTGWPIESGEPLEVRTTATLLCLPDTVDPRGPKRK